MIVRIRARTTYTIHTNMNAGTHRHIYLCSLAYTINFINRTCFLFELIRSAAGFVFGFCFILLLFVLRRAHAFSHRVYSRGAPLRSRVTSTTMTTTLNCWKCRKSNYFTHNAYTRHKYTRNIYIYINIYIHTQHIYK